ncbi:hypothetical protein ABVT39_028286 [Epinephelus coioides]
MAGLCWMAVMLAFSMSIGNSLPVDVTWVTNHAHILNQLLTENVQVCLAVNFPVDDNKLEEVTRETPYVITEYMKNGIYPGTNVVAAIPQKNTSPLGKPYTDHAEAVVLDNIQPLVDNSEGHILVLYSYLSPCGQKCTSTDPKHKRTNILNKIDNAFKKAKWADHAFVFTKVFDGYDITQDDIKETFNRLSRTQIGQNIFRCYFEHTGTSCIKCFNNGVLSDECVHN